MPKPRYLCYLMLAVLVGLAACEGSFSCSTASLSEPKIATAVDPKTQAPTQVVSQIPPTSGPIYATAKVASAPAGTKVKAVFYYLEGQRRQIAENQIELKEGAYVSFQLSPPANGWPLGKYEVAYLLDGKQVQTAQFSVAQDKAAAPAPAPAPQAAAPPAQGAPPAAPAAPAPVAQGYKEINEPNFGFAFQIPSTWGWRLTKSKDYLISGPKGTPAHEVSLVVQIIDKQAGGATLVGRMKAILAQISQVPQGKILKKGEVTMAGQQAPYFLASYQTKDTTGQVQEFGHAQVGVERGRYVFLISYSAPTEIYKAYLSAFQRVVDSFRFTK